MNQRNSIKLKDRIHTFREKIDVQKVIMKQIIQATETKYLNALRNKTTYTITGDVQNILARICFCYGTVKDDTLAEKDQKVREINYNLLDPLVMMYTEIEELE